MRLSSFNFSEKPDMRTREEAEFQFKTEQAKLNNLATKVKYCSNSFYPNLVKLDRIEQKKV